MELRKAVHNRRSVRCFRKKKINVRDIKLIIKAGIWAPSGLNNQPWKFKVIQDEKTKRGLAGCTKYASIITGAEAVICVFLDKKRVYNRDKDIMAIGACVENMLLLARSKNIGSCWLGEILNKKKQAVKILKVSSSYELMAVLAFGYPKKNPVKTKRRKFESFIIG